VLVRFRSLSSFSGKTSFYAHILIITVMGLGEVCARAIKAAPEHPLHWGRIGATFHKYKMPFEAIFL